MEKVIRHKYCIFNRKVIYGFIKLILFILILAICFNATNNITKRKYAYQKMKDFFKQEENFDVLFFGSSHMLYTLDPMQLWKDYGIISYNMGQSNSTIAVSYHNMLLACEYTKPKLVVVDAYRILYDEKVYKDNFSNSMHNTFDAYKLSYMKYLAIKDLCGKENFTNNIVEYLCNFSIYHGRWSELTNQDFKIEYNTDKGGALLIGIDIPNKNENFDEIEVYSGKETINIQYLRKMIEYCNENGIEILVTYNPYPAPKEDIAASKYIQTICDEYNVNYINFLGMDIVDYGIDCYDKNSHVNPSGVRKITDYFGKYIMENYNILDQRQNEKYNFWYEDYNEYIDFKIRNLNKNGKILNNYLILLYGEKDIIYDIKISSKKEIKEGSVLQQLLENLNNNYEINDNEFFEHQDKTIKITTYDNRDGSIIQTVWF